MREFFKSIGLFLYFVIAQCIATVGIMFLKIWQDEDWLFAVNDSILANGVLSEQYFSLISEILFPALIVADIIVLIPMIIAAYRKKDRILRQMDTTEIFFLINLALVLNFIVSFIVEQIPASTSESYNNMMSILTNQSFGIVLLTSGILAPIIEEFIFRYGICEILRKKGDKFAIIISALAFGVAHMNIIQSTYAFLFGLLLGRFYIKDRNLVRPILFHITVNSSSVIYEYAPANIKPISLFVVAISAFYIVFTTLEKKSEKYILEEFAEE